MYSYLAFVQGHIDIPFERSGAKYARSYWHRQALDPYLFWLQLSSQLRGVYVSDYRKSSM